MEGLDDAYVTWADEENEGLPKQCTDLHYINGFCYEYSLAPGESCNVWAFSSAELKWYSISLSANYWIYKPKGVEITEEEEGNEFEDEFVNDFKTKLKASEEIIVEHLDNKECEL